MKRLGSEKKKIKVDYFLLNKEMGVEVCQTMYISYILAGQFITSRI